MNIIDTHQHLLLTDRFRYGWCTGIPALANQRLGLAEYREAAKGTGITSTLFMDSGVDDEFMRAESDLLLEMATKPENRIAGVLASARPEEEGFAAYLDAIRKPQLKGIRRILHVMPDELSQSALFTRNLALLAAHRLTFDLCLLPKQLHLGVALAKKVPNVQFILDHCGVPNVAGGELDPWRASIKAIAELPNVACKVSGVAAYCDAKNVTAAAIRPFVEHCVACFGWDRVIFGGDWPVCNMTSSLGQWVDIAKELMAKESSERQAKFFSLNAGRIYHVEACAWI